MAPPPARPPAVAGAGLSTPAKAPAAKHSMSAILGNIEGLFATARRGALNGPSMMYLRTAIREHYKYVVFHAIKAEKPNPLLDIPQALNPSLGSAGQPPLIDPVAWGMLVSTAEMEARQKQANGTLVAPKFPQPASTSTTAVSTPASSPGQSTTSSGVRPPQAAGMRQQQQQARPAASAASPAGSPAPSSVASFSSQAGPQMRNMLPGTLMKGDELRKWASMPSAERTEIMNLDHELKRRFEASVQWYRAQSRQKEMQAAAQAAAANGGVAPAKSEPATQSNSNQTSSSNPNGTSNGLLGNLNPGFTLSQPPTRNNGNGNPPSGQNSSANPTPSNTQGSNQNLDPSLSSYSAPSQPPPPPPPAVRRVPEEMEVDRRKRKYREWVSELGAGMEVELGLEEILNEVVEKFVNDVTRAGIKLARHRKSDKVEIKDLAFHLDKQYGMTVPGFDAVLPQRTHVAADDEDRKRLRTVIPRNTLVRAADPASGPTTGTGAGAGGEA